MGKQRTIKAPRSSVQVIIDLYKKDLDRSLIRQNLELSIEERLLNLQSFVQFSEEMRKAGIRTRESYSVKEKI